MRIQVRDEQGGKILTFEVRDDGVLDSIEFLWDGLTLNFLADEKGRTVFGPAVGVGGGGRSAASKEVQR